MSLTMMQKRADFRSYLQSILSVHDARFALNRVDVTERRELEQPAASGRKERLAIIGDPIRYCTLHDVGQASILSPSSSMDAAGNVDCEIGHRFDVQIFWGKDYAGSQDDFEAMVYNSRDAEKPGLLDTIRASRSRIVSGKKYMIGLPSQDCFQSIVRDSSILGTESNIVDIAHYLSFNTILIG